MDNEGRFPRELLQKSDDERLAYFEHKVIGHPAQVRARDRLLHDIRQPCGASIIFVFGPTGVGKTTLCRRVEEMLIAEELHHMELDPGYQAVARMEVRPPKRGNFKWRDYLTCALEALHEPLIDSKVGSHRYGVRDDQGRMRLALRQAGEDDLAEAVEKALLNRHPLAFMADEAQHLLMLASGRRISDQMEIIKSLASRGRVLHVLVGTYQLLFLTNKSAQLSRRSIEIHFPRYHANSKEEMLEFASAVLSLQRSLPLEEEPRLAEDWDFLYEYCCGCIGTLKDWMHLALSHALKDKQQKSFRAYLEDTGRTVQQRLNMAKEIADGEQKLIETSQQEAELRQMLGLGAQPSLCSEAEGNRPATASQHSVGDRNPVRDPIGGQENGSS